MRSCGLASESSISGPRVGGGLNLSTSCGRDAHDVQPQPPRQIDPRMREHRVTYGAMERQTL